MLAGDVLDELGAGTDPLEGSALARAILSFLLDKAHDDLVATHYPELKGYAHSTPGVKNASVEFSLETLAPTYHLTIGLPGRSNALAIAARLGLSHHHRRCPDHGLPGGSPGGAAPGRDPPATRFACGGRRAGRPELVRDQLSDEESGAGHAPGGPRR